MSKLILIGGGGHCKSCIDVIEKEGFYTILGYLDKQAVPGKKILGYDLLGDDSLIEQSSYKEVNFFISVGQIQSAGIRQNLAAKLSYYQRNVSKHVSPLAYISSHAIINDGCIVMHHALINAGASIGRFGIINSCASIDHDAIVGDFCHISTGAVVNGDCVIGSFVFIGSNSVLINGIEICDNVVIGAGSVVHGSISEPGVYVGNPARKIQHA